MKKVTLDEMIQQVQETEQRTQEPQTVTQMITAAAMEIGEAAHSGKVDILTDYDADGITSAYIMERTLKSINPDCNVHVMCNDRRGSYGLSPDIQGEADTRYIVLDMGSNQLDLARERLGEDVIMLDHHLIEDEKNRSAFQSLEPSNHSSCLCNPHALSKDDSENAQYCTAGLAYRVYQESMRLCEIWEKPFYHDEKQDNTIAIAACIGTASDMVDVLDANSNNRQILKDGVRLINEASEDTVERRMGEFLTAAGIGLEDTTARNVAFHVGSYMNAASRMSEIIENNGAQLMYNTLSGKYSEGKNAQMLEYFSNLNKQRKGIVNNIQQSSEYQDFVSYHRFEGDSEKLAIFEVPEGTPHAFCGLVAGKLADAIDKPVICVVHDVKTNMYSGSGRNREGYSSLNEFVSLAVSDPVVQEAVKNGGTAHFGGHDDAIGLTFSASVLDAFKDAAVRLEREFIKPDLSDKAVLDIAFSELLKQESVDKVLSLEPLGTGLQLPPIEIEGKQTYARSFAKREDWQSFGISGLRGSKISNWAYDSAQNLSDKKGNIKFLAEITVSTYGGERHLEFSQMWNEEHYVKRLMELTGKEKEKSVSPKKSNAGEHELD